MRPISNPGFFGFDMSDTAEKLWVATSEAPSGAPVHLGNFAFKSSPSGGGGTAKNRQTSRVFFCPVLIK